MPGAQNVTGPALRTIFSAQDSSTSGRLDRHRLAAAQHPVSLSSRQPASAAAAAVDDLAAQCAWAGMPGEPCTWTAHGSGSPRPGTAGRPERWLWTWPAAAPTADPVVQRVELAVGDATCQLDASEVAAVLAAFAVPER